MNKAELTRLIKQKAFQLGFNNIGITKYQKLENEKKALENFFSNHYHGTLSFLERTTNQREDIQLFFPNTKSIIMILASYFPKQVQQPSKYQISYYTYSNDYHTVIKNKLQELLTFIKELKPETNGKIFCDTSPVFEKAYASLANLGWIGKNSLLIHPQFGSFVFLGGIAVDIELCFDEPNNRTCPSHCTLCMDACPTHAIEKPYVLNATKCISYFTLEERNKNFYFNNPTHYIAGCDLCQKVCPFNLNSNLSKTNSWFEPNNYVFWNDEKWETLNAEEFKTTFNKTIFGRIGYEILLRNIKLVTST